MKIVWWLKTRNPSVKPDPVSVTDLPDSGPEVDNVGACLELGHGAPVLVEPDQRHPTHCLNSIKMVRG